jgi:hypothetical protein
MKKFLIAVAIGLHPTLALAYLDPGVSAFIIQGIVGTLAILSGLLIALRSKLKALLSKFIAKFLKRPVKHDSGTDAP